ncbi:MAG: hypothetical protein HYU86_01275 [Chloroflexi bacterium]|nr:hypothetical protein [Chloroflexota bacterium]
MASTQSLVALDLETTGLDSQRDQIIEMAAVKFQGTETVAVYHSLANPQRPLPYPIRLLTGITQEEVDAAPLPSEAAAGLVSFVGDCPIIGQNPDFDLGFLRRHGVAFANAVCDTGELARIFLPNLSDYSLSTIARGLGVPVSQRHRALADALLAKDVFLALQERIKGVEPALLREVHHLGRSLVPFFPESEGGVPERDQTEGKEEEWVTPLTPRLRREGVDIAAVTALLGEASPLKNIFSGFEHRPQQVAMAEKVAEALNEGGRWLVEAGTGVGKSLAYLLPALCFALKNNLPVVISTETISLQEQLVGKDIPELLRVLSRLQRTGDLDWLGVPVKNLRAVSVKGRGNYICLLRLASWRKRGALSWEETRFLLRLMVWLSNAPSGDRADLRLNGEESLLWNQVSAQGDDCLGGRCSHLRQCFLYKARRGAEGAHLVVINHALLFSDLRANNALLPPYYHLIIDEAHHLEEEATKYLGGQVAQRELAALLDRLGGGQRGLLPEIKGTVKTAGVLAQVDRIAGQLGQARENMARLFQSLSLFLRDNGDGNGEYELRLRLTLTRRGQRRWLEVENGWQDLEASLRQVAEGLSYLSAIIEPEVPSPPLAGDEEDFIQRIASWLYSNEELRRRLNAMILNPPGKGEVCWMVADRGGGNITLCSAPLHVGNLLEKSLFARLETVVLTSATLTVEDSFGYVKERLGLEEAAELQVGSPFDYGRSALVYLVPNLPEPAASSYQAMVAEALIGLCRATGGRALVLFTSYSSLMEAYGVIRSPLEREGLSVLAQGVDGPPAHLLRSLRGNPGTVLLGTSSFWEGIDVAGEALSLLVVTRLPFNVPTDPIYAARAETFDDSFREYALPQAVLRFKQGFGRLIRTQHDRGAMVVLDGRLTGRSYGVAFLDSIPRCTVQRGSLTDMPSQVAAWLENWRLNL